MRINGEFCIRRILDEYIAVPVGSTAEHYRGIASVNEVGAFLFELLRTEQTMESLTTAVLREFEVDEPTATKDIAVFLDQMRCANILAEE